MSLWKRADWYWTDFMVNGTRYRLPLHTQDGREAKRLEKEKIADAQGGKLAPSTLNFARLGFTEAAERYLEERRHGLARYSVRTEQERSRNPKAHFGQTPLNRITADNLREYIVWRKQQKPLRGDAAEISNRTVNMEMAFIRRLLKRAKRLHVIADDLKPLPERRDIGRALTPDEKLRLLRAAKGKPEWANARLALTLALNTTMRGCEIKGLEWRDISLMDRTLTIRHSKTEAGERVITLNADALAAILELRERAKGFFGDNLSPDWYVFPSGEGQGPKIGANKATVKPDPTKPMTTWRSAWRAIRAEAAKGDAEKGIPPMPSLERLRFHDARHHAITELAETAASDSVIRSIAGHVSQKMLEHYSHVRLEAKRRALDALATMRPEGQKEGDSEGGYVTRNVTKTASEEMPAPQVFQNAGGDDGTRTRDLMRDRHAF
jgi:integrase